MNSGPADTGEDEFQRGLDRMAAEFSVAMHDEWTEISLNVPVEDFEAASRLFAGLLRTPAIGRDAQWPVH